MTIKELTDWVINKAHFTTIDGFIGSVRQCAL